MFRIREGWRLSRPARNRKRERLRDEDERPRRNREREKSPATDDGVRARTHTGKVRVRSGAASATGIIEKETLRENGERADEQDKERRRARESTHL